MILVTGATGLVGSHLLLKLLLTDSNKLIKAIYRSEYKMKTTVNWLLNKGCNIDNLQWELADINDIPQMEIIFINVKEVYHCAALVTFNPKDKELLNKVNIEGTANMVNLSLHNNIDKFCYVSSIATLGEPKNGTAIDENTEWNPENYNGDYAISKNGGEIEVWRAINEGLNAVIVNPGIIIGGGFWETESAEIYHKINKGFPFFTKGTTGFIAVTDVVNCMVRLMEINQFNNRFILVADNPTFEEVFTHVAIGLNKNKPKYYVSPFITSVLWRIDGFLSFVFSKKRLITKYTAKSAHSKTYYSNKKITETLNYSFFPILNYIELVGEEFRKYKKTA